MQRLIVTMLIALFAAQAFAADTPKTEDQKTLYAIGLVIYREVSPFSLTPDELEQVKQGLTDAVIGKKPEVELSDYTEKINVLVRARRKAKGEKMAGQNKEFLEKAAKEKGAVKTDSGLVYLSLKEGSGASPSPTDIIKVNYRGTLPDGKEFGNSSTRSEPLEMKLDGAIMCWKEGLQKMKTGGKAKLVCPADLAYGENGAGEMILPYATLVFEVDLLEVKKLR